MPRIVVETLINAPPDRCFDLARDTSIHEQTTAKTKERVVCVRRNGVEEQGITMLEAGDEVTFEAVHFGVRQRLTSKIVSFDKPNEFADEMQKGAFLSMRHVHRFERTESGTKMVDILEFEAPGWIFGQLASKLFLARYMESFLGKRGQELKAIAESEITRSSASSETCDT